MSMSDEDNRKMDEIRKFSAIYGRFDCKRKPEKPLTLHEVNLHKQKANSSAMFSFNFHLNLKIFAHFQTEQKQGSHWTVLVSQQLLSFVKMRVFSHSNMPKGRCHKHLVRGSVVFHYFLQGIQK